MGIVENGVVFWVCWGRMVGTRFWCFLVDKLVAGGLDDWEVKIADFVPSTAKAWTRQVGFVGERCGKGSWGQKAS